MNLARHVRIVLDGLAKLVQVAHAVVISALRWNGRIVGLNRRASARRVISRIKIVIDRADVSAAGIRIAVTAAICSIADTCTGAATGTAPVLCALLAPLLPALALTFALTLLAPLTIAGERIHLVAQALDTIQCGFQSLLRIISLLGSCAQSLLRVIHFFFEALHSGRDFRLGSAGVWIDAAPHPIGAALDAGTQIGLLHVAESFAQFCGRGILFVGGQFARRVLHFLFQATHVFGEALAIIGEFSFVLQTSLRPRLTSTWLSESLAGAVRLIALFLRHAACLVGQRSEV